MQRRHRWWSTAVGAVTAGLLLAHTPVAGARKLQMSGTWAIRDGGVFIPLQIAQTVGGVHTSMDTLSKGYGYPNGPILGGGAVSADGSAPQTLRIPRRRFQTSPVALLPVCGPSVIQIASMFVVDAPFETATLRAGGGPGSFQWCPNAALGCPVTGPPNGGTRNGRVLYLAGANQFGGTMQMGLAGGVVLSSWFNAAPFQVAHIQIRGIGPTLRAPAVGRGTPADPWTRMNYLPPGFVTQPTLYQPCPDLVLQPGPKLTTMLGLSTTATGAIFRFPAIGTSAGGMSIGRSTTEYGFAHTTGSVIVQQTAGTAGPDFFTVMGSDTRTALGAGNLSTVAGGLSFRNSLAGQTPFATFHKVWFSLAPPVPSLSPAGAAGAAALLLLAAGHARRRGLGRRP